MLIFLAIALASFIILAGSFLFGHDHDAGHGDLGHGLDHGDASSEPTISVFSTKVIATFTMGFGCAGAIAHHYNTNYMLSSLYGIIAGLVLALVMWGFLSLISRQQASSLVPTNSLIGAAGQVTVPIDANGIGEVGINAAGSYMNYTAKSADGQPLPKGATIRVVNTLGSEVVVEKA